MAKRTKKIRVPRTRNSATMTEAAFWGWIRSALRQRSRWWRPITEAKERAKRPYKGPDKRKKWVYECASCKDHFSMNEIDVDHIVPAGKLKTYSDLPGFVERLFCEVDGLQVLCKSCHDKKTIIDKKNLRKK